MTTRRTFLKVLGATALATASLGRTKTALADVASSPQTEGEFFIFIIAAGGWDVTLWADPRNENVGIVNPASTDNTDTGALKKWVDAPMANGTKSFQLVRAKGDKLIFGPGIGTLADMGDRLTLINGLSMNTVAHPDGQAYSATGRHLQGGRVAASSIDTMVSNEMGKEQLLPNVSIRFPSSFVGDNLDRRVVPLILADVGSINRTLSRAQMYEPGNARDRVTAMLSEEANDLASRSAYPDMLHGFDLQYQALRKILTGNLLEVFNADALKKNHPDLDYKARFAGGSAVNAAFAVEAMKKNLVRSVSFAIGGFDTHNNNYRTQAQLQQETFGLVADTLKLLDNSPHPTKTGKKLSDHTHIMIMSDFCRTPQINLGMGRDHYPNNSALVISPRFKQNFVFGKTDHDQVLPAVAKKFADGERAISPPDLLATFVSAFGVNPRVYLRDGEVVPELLRIMSLRSTSILHAAVMGSFLTACGGAPAAFTKKGGAVSALDVHEVAWNPAKITVGNVRAVAEAGDVVCVFADNAATILVSQAPVSTDTSVQGWTGAAVLTPKSGASQIFGIDAKGRVHALRAQRSFDDVSDRFGLGAKSVRASTALGSGALLFASNAEVFVADGSRVSTFGAPALSELAPFGSGFIGIAQSGIYEFDLESHVGREFALPGVVHAVTGPKGRVVATTKNAVYAADPDGALSLVYAAEGDTLHGLVASGDTVWFADGSELGVVDEGRVRETSGAHIPSNAELAPSPRGDVWVMGSGALARYGMGGSLAAPAGNAPAGGTPPSGPSHQILPGSGDPWRDSLSAVFARSCSSCHLQGGSSGIDLSTEARWQTEKNDIRERVITTKSMPPPGHALSDADRAAIAAFVGKK